MGNDKKLLSEIKLVKGASTSDRDFSLLLEKYAPVYLKLWNDFYLNDMELSDWKQEAAIVLKRTICKYDVNKQITFGSFFKANLKNRLYYILRKKRAQKRVPQEDVSSLSAFEEFYSDTIPDPHAVNPDNFAVIQEKLIDLLRKCSKLERVALINLFNSTEARRIQTNKIKAALERTRNKFKTIDEN